MGHGSVKPSQVVLEIFFENNECRYETTKWCWKCIKKRSGIEKGRVGVSSLFLAFINIKYLLAY